MPDIQFDFEELPLLVGPKKSIALISGHAEIDWTGSARDGFEWTATKVYVEAPIVGHQGATYTPQDMAFGGISAALWTAICLSIETRHDDIVEKIEEAARPDPDTLRDMRREAA